MAAAANGERETNIKKWKKFMQIKRAASRRILFGRPATAAAEISLKTAPKIFDKN